MTTWTVHIPACQWLTANREKYRYARSSAVKAWRHSVVVACQQAKLPTGITPVRIHADVFYEGTRPPVRDRLNLAPTLKAIVDGLGPARDFTRKRPDGTEKTYHTNGYGFLPDDSDKHVLDTTWTIAPSGARYQGWVDLHITHEVAS